jgi:hypothetical protein
MKLAPIPNTARHPAIPPQSNDCFSADPNGHFCWRISADDYWRPISLAALVERDHIAHKAFARWMQTSDSLLLQKKVDAAAQARATAYEWLRWGDVTK